MNARYQKHTEPKGQTRKSSAAAKPSRKKGDSSTSSSSSSSKKPATRSTTYIDPPTPEFKRLRRIWWIGLGSGLALVAVSFGIRTYFGKPGMASQAWASPAGAVALGLAYAAIFYALYIDWSKMRPMRKEYQSGGGKPTKTTKQ